MTPEPAVTFDNVGMTFPGVGGQPPLTALWNLSFSLEPGEFATIVGPSGGGKSTVVNLIAGFEKPSSGAVRVAGRPVAGPGTDRIVVFQDHAVFPWYTSLDNVAYGLRRLGLGKREARRRARDGLAMVGLEDFALAYPLALSGGMRQRVALARALVLRPRILLLDEPFSSVDRPNRRRLQEELLALWRRFGWTVLFVTHNLEEAAVLSDRVLILDPPPLGLRAIETVAIPRPRRSGDEGIRLFVDRLAARMGAAAWGDSP